MGDKCVIKVYKSPQEPYGRPVMVEFEKESLYHCQKVGQ